MTRRAAGLTVRVALFVVFTGYLYAVRFAPYRAEPWSDAEATVLAANAGYPFQLLYPATDGTPPSVRKMSEVYGDYGIHLVLSMAASLGRFIFGPAFRVTSSEARVIVLLLFVITAAAMLSPPVPLIVGAAGLLSLWALFKWGTVGLNDARYWGVTYAAVLGFVYIGTVLKSWTRPRVALLGVLAALTAYSQLLRQEAAPAVYAGAFALLVGAAIASLAARGSALLPTGSAQLSAIARRALVGGLLLAACNAAVMPAERWLFSRAWGTPFAQTAEARHGAGWPLYLGLGYISNPFNIGWRDPIGQVHAQLIQPGLGFADPAFQPTLVDEFLQIVFNRPWLLMQNIAAKAARVHELMNEASGARTGTIITQPSPLVYPYRALPWVMAASLIVLVWRGSADGVIVWFVLGALAAGCCTGPLIVFPEYLGGVQGATVTLVLGLPALVVDSLVDSRGGDRRSATGSARRVAAGYGYLLVASCAVAGIFVAVQALRYRGLENATAAADPVRAINTQQFRYAHVFNDLPIATQGRLVAQLQASTDPSVAPRVDETRGDLNLLHPQVVVRTASQVHVIAWMGRGFVPPLPRLFQGATHASIFVCGRCPPTTTVNDVQSDLRFTMINDLEWQGRYRMFSFPMSPSMTTASFFRVVADRTKALDMSLPTWIVPELIASARFSF